MLRSNNHVDKRVRDMETSFNGNHAKDIRMNTIVVVLAVVVLGAATDVHKPQIDESGNVEDDGGEENATANTLGLNDSALLYIRSLIAKINKISQSQEAEGDEKNETNERSNVDFGKEANEDDKIITNEADKVEERSGDNRRNYILEIIKRILRDGVNYRRLDIEDNGDVSEGIDIDDPMVNEFSGGDSGLKANRGYTGYGASLEMKGRSGAVYDDHPVYYPALPRWLFYSPGFNGYYPRVTSAPVRPINRESILQLQPISMLKTLPHRRTESQAIEETTIDVLDDANSYKYTP